MTKAVLLGLAIAATIVTTATAGMTKTTHGKLCGKTKCVALPSALAIRLAQRNGAYSASSAPKPAPYYRIVIKSTGEGYISSTIIWVPSRKLWFDKQYLSPPLPGYWRTDDPKARPQFTALARKLKAFPAPAHWKTVLPR